MAGALDGKRVHEFFGGFGIQGKDFEVEFFIDLLAFLLRGGGQQVVGHIHEQAQVAGGVFAEGLDERGAQELGIAGGFEQVVEAFLELLGGQGFRAQAAADAAGDGQEVGFFQAAGQALIAGQDDGEDGARVQVGAGQQAQFGQDRGVHFLGFVDQEHGPIERRLRCERAIFPAGFGAVPAVVGRQGDAEEVAQFAVKVGQFGLGPSQDADDQIAQVAQALGEDAQGGAFARAGIADGQGKAAFADLLFDAPAEAFDRGQRSTGPRRALRGRRD